MLYINPSSVPIKTFIDTLFDEPSLKSPKLKPSLTPIVTPTSSPKNSNASNHHIISATSSVSAQEISPISINNLQILKIQEKSLEIQKETLKELRSLKEIFKQKGPNPAYNYKRNSLSPTKTSEEWMEHRMQSHSPSSDKSSPSSNSFIDKLSADYRQPPSILASLDDKSYSSLQKIWSSKKSTIHTKWIN